LTEDLLAAYEADIEQFTLIPSDGGRFEFRANGQLLYSKLQTHRHPEPGEIAGLLKKIL